jgi:hypothetical protein
MSGAAGYATAVAIVVLYIYVALTPFHWAPPQRVKNGAEEFDQGVRFPTAGILRSPGAPNWILDAIRYNNFSLRLSAAPASVTQAGPARIFTVSIDPYHRNITIGQDGTSLVLRLRTIETDLDGQPEFVIPKVFGDTHRREILLEVHDETLSLQIDGENTFSKEIPASALSNWDRTYCMLLGNEYTGDRPWLGEINRAQVTINGRLFDCLLPSAWERPDTYWPAPNWERIVSISDPRGWHTRDVLLNLICFVPLGFSLSFVWPTREWFWLTVFSVALLSFSIEVLQLVFERHPSAIDWIMNLFGAAIGYACSQLFFGKWRRTAGA